MANQFVTINLSDDVSVFGWFFAARAVVLPRSMSSRFSICTTRPPASLLAGWDPVGGEGRPAGDHQHQGVQRDHPRDWRAAVPALHPAHLATPLWRHREQDHRGERRTERERERHWESNQTMNKHRDDTRSKDSDIKSAAEITGQIKVTQFNYQSFSVSSIMVD